MNKITLENQSHLKQEEVIVKPGTYKIKYIKQAIIYKKHKNVKINKFIIQIKTIEMWSLTRKASPRISKLISNSKQQKLK